jgi:hypothetical protein
MSANKLANEGEGGLDHGNLPVDPEDLPWEKKGKGKTKEI